MARSTAGSIGVTLGWWQRAAGQPARGTAERATFPGSRRPAPAVQHGHPAEMPLEPLSPSIALLSRDPAFRPTDEIRCINIRDAFGSPRTPAETLPRVGRFPIKASFHGAIRQWILLPLRNHFHPTESPWSKGT